MVHEERGVLLPAPSFVKRLAGRIPPGHIERYSRRTHRPGVRLDRTKQLGRYALSPPGVGDKEIVEYEYALQSNRREARKQLCEADDVPRRCGGSLSFASAPCQGDEYRMTPSMA